MELKQLKTQLRLLKTKEKSLLTDVKEYQRQLSKHRELITAKELEISAFNESISIDVSNHALLRFLERVSGIDIDKLNSTILSDDLKQAVMFNKGEGTYDNGAFKACFKNYTITTIIA